MTNILKKTEEKEKRKREAAARKVTEKYKKILDLINVCSYLSSKLRWVTMLSYIFENLFKEQRHSNPGK